MAILIKRSQNKDVIIIINTRTREKNFSPFNNFFCYQRKQELKTKDGRDLITTSTLMTAVTNTRSFRCWETKHAYK